MLGLIVLTNGNPISFNLLTNYLTIGLSFDLIQLFSCFFEGGGVEVEKEVQQYEYGDHLGSKSQAKTGRYSIHAFYKELGASHSSQSFLL